MCTNSSRKMHIDSSAQFCVEQMMHQCLAVKEASQEDQPKKAEATSTESTRLRKKAWLLETAQKCF